MQLAIPSSLRAIAAWLLQRFGWIEKRRTAWRLPILIGAAIVFVAGCVISFRELEISPGTLRYGPLLLLMFVFVPGSIAYSAINMVLMAKAAKVDINFVQGMRVSVHAQIAELLPLPGGAIVRTAALMKAGGGAMQSTRLVLAFSLLWVACAACGAGIALTDLGWPALAMTGAGAVAALAIHAWLVLAYGHRVALAAIGLRIAGLCLVALRLLTAFAAIGISMPLVDSFAFAFATIAGSAASIVPAGLGISEGLSALLAQPVNIHVAGAFLATALSRLIGLAINILIALGIAAISRRRTRETAHA